MEFGVINILGIIIVALLMLPNIIFAIKNKNKIEEKCDNRIVIFLEQIGRYSSIFLMIFPLGIREFGFFSLISMFIYMIGNSILLLFYLIVWLSYFIKPNNVKRFLLAITPVVIFLMSGILLKHWLLVGSSLIFGISHLFITYKNKI